METTPPGHVSAAATLTSDSAVVDFPSPSKSSAKVCDKDTKTASSSSMTRNSDDESGLCKICEEKKVATSAIPVLKPGKC